MVSEEPTKDQMTILILGTKRSEKQDFFNKLKSFSLLLVIDKDGRTLINIPAWPALIGLVVLMIMRTRRSRHS